MRLFALMKKRLSYNNREMKSNHLNYNINTIFPVVYPKR